MNGAGDRQTDRQSTDLGTCVSAGWRRPGDWSCKHAVWTDRACRHWRSPSTSLCPCPAAPTGFPAPPPTPLVSAHLPRNQSIRRATFRWVLIRPYVAIWWVDAWAGEAAAMVSRVTPSDSSNTDEVCSWCLKHIQTKQHSCYIMHCRSQKPYLNFAAAVSASFFTYDDKRLRAKNSVTLERSRLPTKSQHSRLRVTPILWRRHRWQPSASEKQQVYVMNVAGWKKCFGV